MGTWGWVSGRRRRASYVMDQATTQSRALNVLSWRFAAYCRFRGPLVALSQFLPPLAVTDTNINVDVYVLQPITQPEILLLQQVTFQEKLHGFTRSIQSLYYYRIQLIFFLN